MSIKYLNLAFALAPTGIKKVVLLTIVDQSNRNSYCYPSIYNIAFRTGCSNRSAIRSISELKKFGFFTVVRETGKPNKHLFLTKSYP